MANEAILNSPEIRSIDNQISGREELLKGETRQLGIPDIAVIGGFTHVPYAGGAGAEAPPATEASTSQAARPSPGTWALPPRSRSSTERRTTRAFAEPFARSTASTPTAPSSPSGSNKTCAAALHQAGFSYANINLTRDAAEASARNLELVTDLYQRGAADIIQLVDAQNQALGAALAAANALYDFLIDALRVQRAAGSFSLEGYQEERDDFVQRLDAFAAERNGRPAAPGARFEPTRVNPREHN